MIRLNSDLFAAPWNVDQRSHAQTLQNNYFLSLSLPLSLSLTLALSSYKGFPNFYMRTFDTDNCPDASGNPPKSRQLCLVHSAIWS